ncbi:FtsL-like putative cell division protein [uncultured Mucilaginibacter sp.]|uniref:FtsL-like putative cell division protein n=1 Tax=uncultured Mucilaginibacter sp. TaxID=797541 RepID=UPI0025D5DCCD|nr:FtsL-like putative cell division protein [uncultured Mucilaginibacter sp.]
MTNRLRENIEVADEEPVVAEKKQVKEIPDNFFTQLFTKGIISTDTATKALPFILYLAFLGMLYIANMHLAEKNIRLIDKLGKEVKELNWDYKTTKAELAFKSTLSEVEKRADTLGIKASVQPPQKLTIEEDK